jgi:hypothetical protein
MKTRRTNPNARLIVPVLLLAMACTAGAQTIFVDANAVGTNNGTSWADAFNYLQDALATASSGCEIRVAQGTYKPDRGATATAGDRTATLQFASGVSIRGGYAGLGTPDPNARDINAYKTILSGDLNGDDGSDFAHNSENSYHVVTASGTDATAVIDGLIITAGNANGYFMDGHYAGGGMRNVNGSPTIKSCVFKQNWGIRGGGMANSTSSPTVVNCTFTGNSSSYGAAMYNQELSNPVLASCTLSGNSAAYGGGIGNRDASSPSLTNCVISGNWAEGGGGIWNYDRCNPTLTNCTISRNTASYGGGVWSYYSAGTITNCILWGDLPDEIILYNNEPVVTYSDVRGGWGSWPGEGNIYADPMFVNAAGGDYRLAPSSHCIDAGNNNAVPQDIFDLDSDGDVNEPLPLDLMGTGRFADSADVADTGLGTAPIVNMGAYEAAASVFLVGTSSVAVPEAGTAAFSVSLLMDPLDQVEATVARQSGDPDITVQSPALLIFDSANYSVPQTVTLAAAKDADCINGQAIISISAAGFVTAYVTATEQETEVPTILYVDTNAAGANTGSSWQNAFIYLQDALATARIVPDVQQIRVAAGTYTPDRGAAVTAGDRTAAFGLLNGVRIRGGYAGSANSDPNARDIEAYKTILSGDLNGDDEPNSANNSDNSYHVVTGSGTNATAVLDGFTITAGNANGEAMLGYDSGGGIHNDNGSPTIINCTFSGNSAGYGGAMMNYQSSPTVINCLLSNNSASFGGAMAIYHSSAPTLINCTFTANVAHTSGGGIWNVPAEAGTTPGTAEGLGTDTPGTIANCIFWADAPDEIHDGLGTLIVTYTCLAGGWPGDGNIDADPMFADVNNFDYRLLPGSPCIDAGNSIAVPPDYTDLDNDANTTEPIPWDIQGPTGPGRINGAAVDVGAYEAVAPPPPVHNIAPVADAGADQTAFAGMDATTQVSLDAGGSYDQDSNNLTYMWRWRVADANYTAEGISPTILLPVGQHTIELIVSDGIDDSLPDQVVVTVTGPIQTELKVYPQPIRRYRGQAGIFVGLRLPAGVTPEQVSPEQLLLYPGGIAGRRPPHLFSAPAPRWGAGFQSAFFLKKQLLEAIAPQARSVELKVVGQLASGQIFFGSATVPITP